ELSAREIEDPGKKGDEHHFRIVARNLFVGGRGDDADIARRAAQRGALKKRFSERHEKARRDALSRHVADRKIEMVEIDLEEIVEVAADFPRREHDRVEIVAR